MGLGLWILNEMEFSSPLEGIVTAGGVSTEWVGVDSARGRVGASFGAAYSDSEKRPRRMG
jgi:hypothetical protein